MKREELLKDMYEVCSFLMKKHDELEAKYGSFPVFEDDGEGDCRWAYEVLESLCGSNNLHCAKQFDAISGYTKTVSELKYNRGDGIRKAMETGQLTFE